MKPSVKIRKALNDPQLLGHALEGDSFLAMRTLLIASMAEKLINDKERAIYKELTQRETSPTQRVNEICIIAGRRGSKSRGLSVLAAYIAGLCDWRDVLVPGEVGVLLCLAQDQKVAAQILNYTEAIFAASPILSQLVIGRTADSIKLKHNIQIQVRPASFKSLRGPTYIAALFDELAFWYTDETNASPDTEVLAAVTPGLLTTRGMIVMASSPYRRRGILWEKFKKHFGPDGAASVLVAKGSTRLFNPTIEQSEIDRLMEDDPAKNSAEYLAEFRTDLESLVAREVVEDCIVPGCHEIAPQRNVSYSGFIDGASGSGQDSFALAIGHLQGEVVVIDALREVKPPFSPELVSKEYADLLTSYHISFCLADKFGGEWVSEQFSKFGVRVDQSAKSKSEMYLDMLAMLSSRRVALLDHPRSVAQICSLERRNRSGGRASIDSPQGQHEDIANCVAGIISSSFFKYNLNSMSDDNDEDDAIMRARRLRLAKANSHWDTEFDHNGQPMVNYAFMFRTGM